MKIGLVNGRVFVNSGDAVDDAVAYGDSLANTGALIDLPLIAFNKVK